MHDFDDDPQFDDLLKEPRQRTLLGLLGELTGATWHFHAQSKPSVQAVQYQLEDLVWLDCEDPAQNTDAARQLVEFVLSYVGKYRLAASVHLDATQAGYAELQRQNEALKLSEQRYRDLSESLQQRVEEQVATIQQAQQQLYDSARLRSVGQLAAGVAHEINNPIGFISSNLTVAQEYLGELLGKLPADQQDDFLVADFTQLLAESSTGAKRIAAIVADLKTFSNINQEPCQHCDIDALLATAIRLTQAEFGSSVKVDLVQGRVQPLLGYPARLSQAFFNVLLNAAQATDSEGRVTVRSLALEEGGIEVTVQDSGLGMSQEVLDRAFEPFFTTRDVGAGAGLGLTVARDVALAHRGSIELETVAGEGTRVRLVLRGVTT
ncbi:MAG: sensor histidine kinase [Pseudomonas sp.]